MGNHQIQKRHRGGISGGYFAAILFIVVGLLLLGKNLGIIAPDFYNVIVSWQMLFVAIGVYTFIQKEYTAGLIIIGIGCYSMLSKLDWLGINLAPLFWPAVFIIIGVASIVKMNKGKKRVNNYHHHYDGTYKDYQSENGFIQSDNQFSSARHIIGDEVFKGGIIKNRFGATIIDLRRARLEDENTYLNIECYFGGIEIYLPGTWKVQTEMSSFLGGCDDTRLTSPNMDMTHKLVLRGNLSFGGIEIKN